MRLDGLRLQLLGLFVLPIALAVVAVAVLSTGIHRSAMRDLVASRDERAASSAAAAIEEAIRSRTALIGAVAAHAASGDAPLSDPGPDDPLSQSFPIGIAVIDRNGSLEEVSGSLKESDLVPSDDLDELQTGMVLIGSDSGRVALFTARETGVAAVGAVSLLDLLRSATPTAASPHNGSSTYLVGPRSELLISLGAQPPATLESHAGVQAVLRGERGSSFLDLDDGEHVVAFAPVSSTGWGLIIEEPWHSVTSSVLDLSLLAPFAVVPILLVTIAALWFGARRVIEPLRQLEQAAAELPGGDPSVLEETEGGIAEIQELRSTLVRMAERIRDAQAALRGYIGAITAAQEEERRRVARELHDESIQHWIALDQRLQIAAKALMEQDSPGADLLTDLRGDVQQGITELRRLSRGLRPLYLEDLGLTTAVEMLTREAQETLGIPVNFRATGEPRRLPPQGELAVYRLVQEGLANITRHAGASSAEIRFDFGPDELEVQVIDDGAGFDPPDRIEDLAKAGHYGLMGMLERAESLRGQLKLDSSPGQGTTLKLTVPLS